MRLSRTTFVAPIPGRAEALVVQPLTSQAAIVGEREARALEALDRGGALPPALDEATLREARFVVDSDAEDDALAAAAWSAFAAEAGEDPDSARRRPDLRLQPPLHLLLPGGLRPRRARTRGAGGD